MQPVARWCRGPAAAAADQSAPAPTTRWLTALCIGVVCAPACAAMATASAPVERQACEAALEAHRIGGPVAVTVAGRRPADVTLRATPGHELLIVAREAGNDVALEVTTASGATAARSDNPVRRNGRQSVITAPDADGRLRIRLTGKEHDAVTGRVTVGLYDPAGLAPDGPCLAVLRALAAADASYARGQDVSLGRAPAGTAAARHDYLLAAEEYLRAYTLLGSGGDGALTLAAAHALAALYYQELQEWARSADWAERAQVIAADLHLDYEAARARALLASAWIELATRSSQPDRSTATPAAAHAGFERARALLRTLEQFHRRRGEHYDATLQLNNIGVADIYEGRDASAEREFRQASDQFGALRERPRQGLALQNLAVVQWSRGDLVAAAGTFRRALEALTPEPYPKLYLIALTNSALVNFAVGNFDTALRLNARALAFAERVANRPAEADSLYGLGVTYDALGDRTLARRYLEESLKQRTAEVDARGRVASLRALSSLYGEDGRYGDAVRVDEEALALSSSASGRAHVLVRLAADQAAIGRTDQALPLLATVLDAPTAANPGIRIEALTERGHLARLARQSIEAERDLRSALDLISHHDSPESEFRAQFELALTLRSADRPDDALEAVNRALSRADELRRQTANPEFRAVRQEPLRPAFDLKLSLLAERHRQLVQRGLGRSADRVALAALATAESARAQSLIEQASQGFPAGARGSFGPMLERRERLYRDLAARRFLLAERENAAGADDLKAATLRADITALRLTLDTLNADLARATGVRAGPPPFAVDEVPGWLRGRAPETVLVEYWLGAEEAYAWTITGDGIRFTPLGASGPISDAARAFHAVLRNSGMGSVRERGELAAALYDRILRPLDAAVPPGRALVVIPDGALNYVPFAALRTGHADSARYLIEDRNVAVAPAVRWLARQRVPGRGVAPPARFLLVSDPIYRDDDERLVRSRALPDGRQEASDWPETRQLGSLPRLPWTAHEAAVVAALLPEAQVDRLSGAGATRARVLHLDWTQYRVIHLASHGFVDAGMPQLSALVLSAFDEHGQRVEQTLRASDLAPLTLKADLVVLSACDTALGKEVAGEGALGLASTAMARGAGAVLASLWQAPDEMSARLMTEFYRGILTQRAGPVAALGAAMRAVLAADRGADPALWSVFQLSVGRLDERSLEAGGRARKST